MGAVQSATSSKPGQHAAQHQVQHGGPPSAWPVRSKQQQALPKSRARPNSSARSPHLAQDSSSTWPTFHTKAQRTPAPAPTSHSSSPPRMPGLHCEPSTCKARSC
ncbi:unnamed protein product [Prunus armeniaca]